MSHILRRDEGYSLVEMLIVMVILGVVMTALAGVITSGTYAELNMNRRFQAQQNARLALDKIRKDIHCAQSAAVTTVSGTPTTYSLTLTTPSGCGGNESWCTASVGGSSTRFALYRESGTTCDSTNGTLQADYLTQANAFPTYSPQSPSSLAALAVDFKVSVNGSSVNAYHLQDTIFLRNSTRS